MRPLRTSAPVNFAYVSAFDEDRALASEDFVALLAEDAELRADLAGTKADLNMIALTYFYLREAGYSNIALSREARPGHINILHTQHLRDLRPDPECFYVSVQGDFPRRAWAQFHIQQNRDLAGRSSRVMWLWPQPGIIPRDAARRDVRRVGYLGQIHANLAWDIGRWERLLAPLGLEFVTAPPSEWHDFSSIDVAIGIRGFGGRRYSDKPPSKLVNAWFACVPFIGGADSAYTQVGTPGEDFIRATEPAEVVAALTRLRDDPAFYRGLVAAGRERSCDFTVPALIERWAALLEGPIERRFREWRAHPRREEARRASLGAYDAGLDAAKALARRVVGRR